MDGQCAIFSLAVEQLRVRRYPVPVIEYLYDGIGFTDIHLLADETERDRIEVAINADVVIELDRETASRGVFVARPGQRQEERSLFQVKQSFSAALLLLEGLFVVFDKQAFFCSPVSESMMYAGSPAQSTSICSPGLRLICMVALRTRSSCRM